MNLKHTYNNSLTTAISSSMPKEYPETEARRVRDIREFLYKFIDFPNLEVLFSISRTFKGIQVLYELCINSLILLPFSNFVNNFVISSSKLDQISAKQLSRYFMKQAKNEQRKHLSMSCQNFF